MTRVPIPVWPTATILAAPLCEYTLRSARQRTAEAMASYMQAFAYQREDIPKWRWIKRRRHTAALSLLIDMANDVITQEANPWPM